MGRKLSCPQDYHLASTCDEVVKSRHSRLPGIVVLYNVMKRNDSGQAGMTSKEGYPTFYETITCICFSRDVPAILPYFTNQCCFSGFDLPPDALACNRTGMKPPLTRPSPARNEGGLVMEAACYRLSVTSRSVKKKIVTLI
jgi:hypothetical protein